ncbi:hypothetical protein B0H11DRAFT_2195725 [Mycena galericulata]|nr:hypothetical protein B0H11DRAFT_2195725 [Mycena galericulata]
MVFVKASILFSAAACVLPSVMGLTLNTPTGTDADGVLNVTWTTVASDPVFALELVGPVSIDAATGVEPATLAESVNLGSIPPGTYKVQAVVGDDIATVLSTSGDFTIGAAGAAVAAAAGDNSAAGGAAAAAPPPPPAAAATTAAAAAATGAAAATTASAGGPPFDPAGVPNVGNGVGKQFIGGQCLSAADCASGCCAGPSGICSGPGAATQAGKTGCGFVSTAPGAAAATSPAAAAPAGNAAAAAAAPATAAAGGPPFDPAGTKNVGNGKAAQFIGGQCLSAADCASGCCAGPSGICSGTGAATQAGKTGCGFLSVHSTSICKRGRAGPGKVKVPPSAARAAVGGSVGGNKWRQSGTYAHPVPGLGLSVIYTLPTYFVVNEMPS